MKGLKENALSEKTGHFETKTKNKYYCTTIFVL